MFIARSCGRNDLESAEGVRVEKQEFDLIFIGCHSLVFISSLFSDQSSSYPLMLINRMPVMDVN